MIGINAVTSSNKSDLKVSYVDGQSTGRTKKQETGVPPRAFKKTMRLRWLGNLDCSTAYVTAVKKFPVYYRQIKHLHFLFLSRQRASLISRILPTVPLRYVLSGFLLEYTRKRLVSFPMRYHQRVTTINFITADIANGTIKISGRDYQPALLRRCTDMVD